MVQTETGQLTRKVGHNVLWNGLTVGLQSVLSIFSLAILVRFLTPAEYGVVSAAQVFIQLGILLSSLGFGPALIQRAAIRRELISTALFLSLLSGFVFTAAMWVGSSTIAIMMHVPELDQVCRVLSIVMILQAVTNIAEALVTRGLRFRTLAVLRLLSWATATFAGAIPCAYFGLGYWSLVVGRIAELAIYAAGTIFLARRDLSFPRFNPLAFDELRPASFGYTLAYLGSFLAGNIDNVFVSRYLGPVDLGIYTRAYVLISMPATMFSRIAEMIVFPTMARIQNDVRRFSVGYLTGIQITAVTIIPVSAFIFVFAPQIVNTVLGQNWSEAILPIRLFAVAIYFRVGYKTFAIALHARARSYTQTVLQGVYGVFVTVGASVGVNYGLPYVCAAIVFALAVNFAAYAVLGMKEASVSFGDVVRLHIPAFAAATVVGAVATMAIQLTPGFASGLQLLIGVAACAIIYVALLCSWPVSIVGHRGVVVLSFLLGSQLPWFTGIIRIRAGKNID